MIKLGDKRINPGNITMYYPHKEDTQDKFFIKFDFINQSTEIIKYETIKERDDMLHLLDKYFLSFDNGIEISSESHGPQFILDGPQGSESGPGGMSMQ
jgi:hypothetical protein